MPCGWGGDSKKTVAADVLAACYDKTKECKNATGGWKVAFGTSKTSSAWKSATDAECADIGTAGTNCRIATTGLADATAMGTVKAWKSALDSECVAMTTTDCRCADLTKGVGGNTSGACKVDLTSCGTLVALSGGHCAEPMSTTLGWKTKTDSTCAKITSGVNCRCADKTVGTGVAHATTGVCTTACPVPAAAGAAAGEGEGGEGEGEGGAAAGEGKASGAFVALLLMIINLF